MTIRKAFTLIELLVVVAIVSLLAAILFPAFGRVREMSRRASCQSNLKQIGLGMAQYVQDFDERYIPFSVNGYETSSAFRWNFVLQPYTKSRQLFRCPSNTINLIDGTQNSQNYTYNQAFGLNNTSCVETVGTKGARLVSQVPLPSQSPIVVDALGASYPAATDLIDQSLTFYAKGTYVPLPTGAPAQWTLTMYGFGLDDPAAAAPQFTRTSALYPLLIYYGCPGATAHQDGANYLFADGHVKWLAAQRPVVPFSVMPMPASVNLDYCPDGVVGTASTFG